MCQFGIYDLTRQRRLTDWIRALHVALQGRWMGFNLMRENIKLTKSS